MDMRSPSFTMTSFPSGTHYESVTQCRPMFVFVESFTNSDWIRWFEKSLNVMVRMLNQEGLRILSGLV